MNQKIKDDQEAMAALGKLTIFGLAIPVAVGIIGLFALMYGGMVRCFWGWFVTPAFGIAAPSVAVCIGLALLAQAIVGRGAERKTEDYWLGKRILWGLVQFGFGYIVHLFV